jgi:hypothetical protein
MPYAESLLRNGEVGMARVGWVFGVVSAMLLASVQVVGADSLAGRWFRDFDKIADETKIPTKQRDRGAWLVMRVVAGVCKPAEYAEAQAILAEIAQRYRKAAKQLAALPIYAEAEDMRLGYINYYKGVAKLCEDCVALREVYQVGITPQPLTPEEVALLTKRKHLLDQLLLACKAAEFDIRTAHGLALAKVKGAEN